MTSSASSLPDMTHMAAEIGEIPDAVARLLGKGQEQIARAAQTLRRRSPSLIVTVARGSSDHAATFLKYAIELNAGVPVASLGPSIASVYGGRLKLENAALLAISQSGASPDIIAATKMGGQNGALCMALTNQERSPLAQECTFPVDIMAGPEHSVAATKSFVSSIVAGLLLLAGWQDDKALAAALDAFPRHARAALECDWSALGDVLEPDASLYVLGRGPGWAIANEAALKFKETCGLHAEAYSAAEVMHGPMALVEKGFPLLTLCARDATRQSSIAASERLAEAGAAAFITARGARLSREIGFVETGHPLTDALCLVIPFYVFVERQARALGLNPDRPPLLRKVTRTR